MNSDSPPSRENIAVGRCLDSDHLIRHFLGKTKCDAAKMFQAEGGAFWTEDFQYMTPIAFDYYFDPAAAYLRSDAAEQDLGFVSGFLLSMAWQMKEGQLLPATQEKVRSLAKYLRANSAKFDLEFGEWQLSMFAEIEA